MDEKKLKSVAAVIRTYNNPHIAKQVKNLLTIGVGQVVVVVNAAADNGSTRGYLGDLARHGRVEIIEMQHGYTWANALNRALLAIEFMNKELILDNELNVDAETGFHRATPPVYTAVFNVSVEALFTKEHVEKMLASFGGGVAVVGTSFQGLQDGNKVDLGRSYRHPRNTGMMLKLDALNAFCGSFDTWCDDIGGMEDIEFVLRLKAFTDKEVAMLDLRVPLIVGKNYHQPTKEAREQEAMKKIVARLRGFRDRIEDVIREMRIEE